VKVCICGLPDSGNRLVSRLLEAHGVETIVQHHPAEGIGAKYERAVVPVRRPRVWTLAMAANHEPMRHWSAVTRRGGLRAWNSERMARIGAEWEPEEILFVELAAIHTDPDRAGETICEHAGVPFEDWPERVIDPDAKYLEGVSEP